MNMSSYFCSLILLSILIAPSSAANDATTNERCHPHDKRALLRIKQQSFANSTFFDSWNPSTDCCNGWFSVQCDDSTNRIVSLIITIVGPDANIQPIKNTPFPSALGNLPYLKALQFNLGGATGPIPTSLSKLRHLIFLNLSFNRLTGPIPSFLGTLKTLVSLRLSFNLLSGPIPPSLALLPSISTLDLQSNKLAGTIPASFGSFKNQMSELYLSDNMLSGEIPRSLEKAKFVRFEVSGNKLTGDASFLFSHENTDQWGLQLSNNSFSFDMTGLRFPPNIVSLDISHNRIYGSLPKGLAGLSQLTFFNVSYNLLCGRIPTGGRLDSFDRTTYIHNKCLCGAPLPSCK